METKVESNVFDLINDDAEEEKILCTIKKRQIKKRKGFTEDHLCSPEGMQTIYDTFPKLCKFRGRGHESSDLKNMMYQYKLWAFRLHPGVAFPDILADCERFGNKKQTKECLQNLRECERNRYNDVIKSLTFPVVQTEEGMIIVVLNDFTFVLSNISFPGVKITKHPPSRFSLLSALD